MPQRVRPNRVRDSNAPSRFANGSLGHRLVEVMPAPLARTRVSRDGRGGEDPLPTPFAVRVWLFARQSIGKADPSEPCRQVGRVELANPFEMSAQPWVSCYLLFGPLNISAIMASSNLADTNRGFRMHLP